MSAGRFGERLVSAADRDARWCCSSALAVCALLGCADGDTTFVRPEAWQLTPSGDGEVTTESDSMNPTSPADTSGAADEGRSPPLTSKPDRDGSSSKTAPPEPDRLEPGSIVFRSERDRPGIGDLYVMDADGSNVRRLTEGGEFSVPLWAPDGKAIAFRATSGLDTSVGLIATEGGGPVLLATGSDAMLGTVPLTWLGDDLLYAAQGEEPPSIDLWLTSRSGGQHRPLKSTGTGQRQSADVSRIDSRIVYVVGLSGPEMPPSRELWLIDGPDDTEPFDLTLGRVYFPGHPRWSPDGKRIAFVGFALDENGGVKGFGSNHGQPDGVIPDSELFVIELSTGELTRLTDNDQDDYHPAWTPDGAHLVFSSGLDGSDEDIWMLSLDDPGQLVNLIDDDDRPRSDAMPDVLWSAPASD